MIDSDPIVCLPNQTHIIRRWVCTGILALLGIVVFFDPAPDVTPAHLNWRIYSAVGCLLAAFVSAIWTLHQRRLKLEFTDEKLVAPNGATIKPAEITELDLRDWNHRGLAQVRYLKGYKIGKVTIDEFQFAGATKIVQQLLTLTAPEAVIRPSVEPGQNEPNSPDPNRVQEAVV